METVVLLSGVPYKGLKQRPQHFADYLCRKGFEVIYIGMLEDIDASVEELGRIGDKETLLDLLFRKNEKGVYVLGKRDVKATDRCRMDDLLAKISEVYAGKVVTYIVSFPGWLKHITGFPPGAKIVYDCLDNWESFLKDLNLNYNEELIYYERKLASIADLVLVSANRLYAKMAYYNQNVYYLPNGVFSADYRCNDPRVPADMQGIKQPVIFFMGGVSEWVDVGLIQYLAELRPDYSFVFVGDRRVELPRCPNVHFLGRKRYEELASYLSVSRVAIIPFKVNNLTAAVTPLKLYEYLGSGTPVVSTILPDIIGLEGVVVAVDYREFLAALDRYVSMDEETYEAECRKALNTAKAYEWNDLLEPLYSYIKEDALQLVSTREFLEHTAQKYRDYEQHPLIKNELLGLYTAMREYRQVGELFSFDDALAATSNLDYEKLALAYAMQGKFAQAVDLLKSHMIKDKQKVYIPYLYSLLAAENREELVKIFLLKLSGDTYEALKLSDALAARSKTDPKLLGLMSSLYLDLAEFDLAFQLALEVFDYNDTDYVIEELFDFYTIKFIVKSLCKYNQYLIAEEILLSLMNNPRLDWKDEAVKILADVYVSKTLESGIRL